MSIFTQCSTSDGCFATGKIPDDLKQYTSHIRDAFYSMVLQENKQGSSFHVWFDNLSPDIKELVTKIQKHPMWQKLCHQHKTGCKVQNISKMDELYYSKAPKINSFLYGSAANYDMHIDGIYSFPGVTFYRVLVGLTGNNDIVETSFPRLHNYVYINRDDFVIFDFDKAQHKVIKHKDDDKHYRILLKLHFLVCENCSATYLQNVSNLYIAYEKITRYIINKGTNPSSWIEFFFGLLGWLFIKHKWIVNAYICIFLVYIFAWIIKRKEARILGIFLIDSIIVFLVLTTIFWIRFRLFDIR